MQEAFSEDGTTTTPQRAPSTKNHTRRKYTGSHVVFLSRERRSAMTYPTLLTTMCTGLCSLYCFPALTLGTFFASADNKSSNNAAKSRHAAMVQKNDKITRECVGSI